MAAEWQDVCLEGLYTKLSRHLDTLYQHLLFFYSLQFPINIVASLGGIWEFAVAKIVDGYGYLQFTCPG